LLYILQQTNRKQVTIIASERGLQLSKDISFIYFQFTILLLQINGKKKQPLLLAVNKLIQRYIGVTSFKLKIEEL